MKTTLATLVLSALPTLLLAQTVEIDTASGKTAVPFTPEKVVSFDLAAIDDLAALGVTVAGVPDITPPAYLADAVANLPTVGTLFEPDFEALAVMAPVLIIVGGRSQKQAAAAAQLAPTIDMTINGETLVADAQSRITAYGEIFGKQDKATALLAEMDASFATAQAAAAGKGDVLIVMANGGKISAYGDDSRFGWVHTTLGLPEAYPDLKAESHGEAISFEFIAEVDPDWILVVDRGAAIGQDGEAAAVTLDNPLVAGTKAGKAGQIVYLDSAPLYLAGGGFNSMMGTIAQITDAFSPVSN